MNMQNPIFKIFLVYIQSKLSMQPFEWNPDW